MKKLAQKEIDEIEKILEIRKRHLDKITQATIWGNEGKQIYIGNVLYDAIEDAIGETKKRAIDLSHAFSPAPIHRLAE